MMAAVIIASCLILLFLGVEFFLYRLVFCHPVKKRPEMHTVPDSRLYKMHKDKMLERVKETERAPHESLTIKSYDGYMLAGKLYEFKKGAPLMIFFHGYHGIAEWDGYGFFKICADHDINILMADERAHGMSEGNEISFGINERHDCISWIKYAEMRFGSSTDIILAGVSMGAATVMMASELGFPENVRCMIADCGYTEPSAMVKETVRKMKLPVKPVYALIKLSARIFGHDDLNLEQAAAVSAVEKLTIPILFIHGSEDSIVPVSMNDELYEKCRSPKKRLVVAGADHANSSMTDFGTYEREVWEFLNKNLTYAG